MAVLTVLLAVQLLLVGQLAASQGLPEVEQYAQRLAQQRLFAGMLHVEQGNATVFSRGFGLASYELGVPMRNDHRYPIGSNTKLFTAVAAWQLHRAGKLSVYEPAAKYMNAKELGLDGPWCPRLHGEPKTGPCQQPQIQHLLRMSGGVMGIDNCAYKDDAWQQQYCMDSPTSPMHLNFTEYQTTQLGAASIADYLRLTGVLAMPLEFAPGASYHYSNPGYSIVGHIIEKVSGMPLADYFRINIFEKHGLSSTLYDPTTGVLGLHKQQLPYPAYITYLQPGQDAALADNAGASIQQLESSAGSARYWGGDVQGNARIINTTAAAGELQSGNVSVGMTAKYPGTSGFDWTLANAAGAIVSTPQDMAKWFRALLVRPDHLGLGKDLLKEFLTLSTDVPGMPRLNVSASNGSIVDTTLVFAQGLVVLKDPDHARGLGVSNVYYLGSLGGFQASVYMRLDPKDAAKDVFVNAVGATVLPARSDWPSAAQNLTGTECLTDQRNTTAVAGTTSRKNTSSGTAAVGGRHRRLLNSDIFKLVVGAASGAADAPAGHVQQVEATAGNVSVFGVLCELSNMEPSAIKTVPDMLARKAFRGLTGCDWFDLH